MGPYVRVSNYRTFLDQVSKCGRVCLVTFNYDTLLERALAHIDLPIGKIDDYTTHRQFKLFKLHGSINWWRWIPRHAYPELVTHNEQPPEQVLINAAPVVDGVDARMEMRGLKVHFPETEQWFFTPALAVPTTSKHTFVCPQSHLERLKEIIPQIERIIVVGWRGRERHFLGLLKEGLKGNIPVVTACGSTEASPEPYNRMKEEGLPVALQMSLPLGFSEIVMGRSIEPLLTTEPAG